MTRSGTCRRVADPAHRGARASAASSSGTPSAGVASKASRRCGLRSWWRQWSHPSKEFLKAWYTRIVYLPVRTGPFEESYPELAPLLATPCDFVIYHNSFRTLPAREDGDNGHC